MDWEKFSFEYWLDLGEPQVLRSLVEIEGHKEASTNLVLAPDWQKQLDKLNRVRAVYGTTALEGNPLSEDEVSEQLEILDKGGKVSVDQITKEQMQIRNAGLAQEWIRQRFQPGSPQITLEDIIATGRTAATTTSATAFWVIRLASIMISWVPIIGLVPFAAPWSGRRGVECLAPIGGGRPAACQSKTSNTSRRVKGRP